MKVHDLIDRQIGLSNALDSEGVSLEDQIRLLGGCLAYAARRMEPIDREAALAAQIATILMTARGECALLREWNA